MNWDSRDAASLVPGAFADFVVLDDEFRVVETYIGGVRAYGREITELKS